MDNLGSHKGRAVRMAIRAAGAKLFFLPAYSPDLNPIEQAFASVRVKISGASTQHVSLADRRPETYRNIPVLRFRVLVSGYILQSAHRKSPRSKPSKDATDD
jgi:transposase